MSGTPVCTEQTMGSKSGACRRMVVRRFGDGEFYSHADAIIQEIRISVVLDGEYCFEATCSPWDIEELVIGNLFLSGSISSRSQIKNVAIDAGNCVVRVNTCPGRRHAGASVGNVVLPFDLIRQGRSIEDEGKRSRGLPIASDFTVSAEKVNELVSFLECQSHLFHQTGGVHSAVLSDGRDVLAWFEDIGRHSAFDKLAGWCLLNDVPTDQTMVLFSGRVPYEIISKAIKLGCPVIASPSAPTDLSIETARRHGVTLIGFAKRREFNVYAHPERVVS